ncbi:MAG TPA: hypothetical protein VJS16_05725 [Gammaproteobacteria bacterium]|nr:hypothetical protein [Gammaproteobacteria bacterium]
MVDAGSGVFSTRDKSEYGLKACGTKANVGGGANTDGRVRSSGTDGEIGLTGLDSGIPAGLGGAGRVTAERLSGRA